MDYTGMSDTSSLLRTPDCCSAKFIVFISRVFSAYLFPLWLVPAYYRPLICYYRVPEDANASGCRPFQHGVGRPQRARWDTLILDDSWPRAWGDHIASVKDPWSFLRKQQCFEICNTRGTNRLVIESFPIVALDSPQIAVVILWGNENFSFYAVRGDFAV